MKRSTACGDESAQPKRKKARVRLGGLRLATPQLGGNKPRSCDRQDKRRMAFQDTFGAHAEESPYYTL